MSSDNFLRFCTFLRSSISFFFLYYRHIEYSSSINRTIPFMIHCDFLRVKNRRWENEKYGMSRVEKKKGNKTRTVILCFRLDRNNVFVTRARARVFARSLVRAYQASPDPPLVAAVIPRPPVAIFEAITSPSSPQSWGNIGASCSSRLKWLGMK